MTGRWALIALAALLGAGCGGEASQPGDAGPSSLPPGVSSAQVLPPPGLAKDARGVVPCQLLTKDQARRLGIELSSAEPFEPGLIPGCSWRPLSPESGKTISVTIDTTVGLVNLYKGQLSTPYKIFEPLQIDGYPAVRAEQVAQTRDCTVYVGLAENQAMWVRASSFEAGADNCPRSREAISAILGNLPPLG